MMSTFVYVRQWLFVVSLWLRTDQMMQWRLRNGSLCIVSVCIAVVSSYIKAFPKSVFVMDASLLWNGKGDATLVHSRFDDGGILGAVSIWRDDDASTPRKSTYETKIWWRLAERRWKMPKESRGEHARGTQGDHQYVYFRWFSLQFELKMIML